MPPFTLQGRKRLLRFHGPCLSVLPWCEAMCCRDWNVELTPREFESGLYRAGASCKITKKACDNLSRECFSRAFYLEKKKNNDCVYLKKDSRCSLYAKRPGVCRVFTCRKGWSLAGAAPGRQKTSDEKKPDQAARRKFMEKISPSDRFTPQEEIRLKLCYYQPEKKKIYFIKQLKKGCGNAITHSHIPGCGLDENGIIDLLSLFTRRNTLSSIHRRFLQNHPERLSLGDIKAFAWLFMSHDVIRPVPC